MITCGWSATAGAVLPSTRCMAPKISQQTLTLIFNRRTPIRAIRPSKFRRSYRSCSGAMDSDDSINGGITSSDLVEKEYSDLNLKELYGGGQIGHVRIRQHVNPLSSSFSVSGCDTCSGSSLG